MEVDIAPKHHPELEAVIEGSIGELSPFHQTFGFYVDGVDIDAIVLPRGWAERVIVVENANTNGFRGLCLDPTDLAVSKLAAGRGKDIEFVRVLLRETIVAPSALSARSQQVENVDGRQRATLSAAVDQLVRQSSPTQ
jgi:hypothetical protein